MPSNGPAPPGPKPAASPAPPPARRPVPPPPCDRCLAPVDTLHYDGTALLCAACCRGIAAAKVAPADILPIRLVRRRPDLTDRLETK